MDALQFFRPSPSGPIFPELAENVLSAALALGHCTTVHSPQRSLTSPPSSRRHRLCRISPRSPPQAKASAIRSWPASDELAPFHLTEMHPIPSRAGSTGYRKRDTRDRRAAGKPGRAAGALNASHPADAPPLGAVRRKPTREHRIRLRSQRSGQSQRRSLQRSAVAFALGIAL